MSALPHSDHRWQSEEYLVFERSSDTKHELIDGYIVAMVGASRAHNLIATNIGTSFNVQLQERPCEVYVADMRVQVEAATYTYPDVVVACDDPQFAADGHVDTLLNPTILVEVLSDSTELRDRVQKLTLYRVLSSLQAYLLVTQDKPRIECYTRHENNSWLYTDTIGLAAVLELATINCELALADVYRKVTFDTD